MKYMQHITNNFPGDQCMNVHNLFVSDRMHPFEHDFFYRLSRAFPLLNHLPLFNRIPQEKKRTWQSFDNKHAKYPHLTQINLEYAHINYVEQFLLDTNAYLPCLNQLKIQFEHLVTVTNNFRNNATRINCAKLKRIVIREDMVHSSDFYSYFPLL